ncbi:MAG: hypothetical protein KJ638_04180 [Chloroflexi bacterium]|nr:hypothetical protein [Chloroflexota bacterium]
MANGGWWIADSGWRMADGVMRDLHALHPPTLPRSHPPTLTHPTHHALPTLHSPRFPLHSPAPPSTLQIFTFHIFTFHAHRPEFLTGSRPKCAKI